MKFIDEGLAGKSLINIPVERLGNDLAVRIPHAIAAEFGMHVGDEIHLIIERGRIVIAPVRVAGLSIEALVDRVTDENIHGAVDFGQRVGAEAW